MKLSEKLDAKADRDRLCGADYLELDEWADEAAALEARLEEMREKAIWWEDECKRNAGAWKAKCDALEARLQAYECLQRSSQKAMDELAADNKHLREAMKETR